jgi:hypothetical protein
MAQLARVYVPGKPVQSIVMWHSSLLGQFVSYKENEVIWIQTLSPMLPLGKLLLVPTDKEYNKAISSILGNSHFWIPGMHQARKC